MEEVQTISPKQKRTEFLIGFLISFGITGLMFGIILLVEFFGLNLTMESDGYLIFIDALTVSGGLMLLFYLLTLLTNEGSLDIITYSIKLVWYTTFHRSLRNVKLAKNYTEYRLEKKRKDHKELGFLALGGAPYLLVGLILLIPYYILVR